MTTQLRAIRRAIDAGLDAVAALRDAERAIMRHPETPTDRAHIRRCLNVADGAAVRLLATTGRLVGLKGTHAGAHRG